jgi:hypothetical protein
MRRAEAVVWHRLPDAPALTSESEKRIVLSNGSTVRALHGSEKTVRGYAAIDLVIIDEASAIDDELISAVMPMTVTTKGAVIALTTPRGLRGWFSDTWHSSFDDEWQRIKVETSQCPRLTETELKKQLRDLGPAQFRQEFGLEFLANSDAAFMPHIIDAAISEEVKPLWPC